MSRIFKIKNDLCLNVIQNKMKFFIISLLLTVVSIACLSIRGLNYGIDFKGGINLQIQTSGDADLADLRAKLKSAEIGDFSLQEFGAKDSVLIKMENLSSDSQGNEIIKKVKDALGPSVNYRNIENVGPKIGKELKEDSTIAVCLALAMILLWIWIRFDWQFGVCGVIALLHDCIAVLGFFAIFHNFEFNIAAVVAILTTAGYSINDSVVIFDRINENITLQKYNNLTDLINGSISETLSRTLLTSVTTLIALLCLCLFGGDVISSYATPMFVGIAIGTFSSIFVSAPLLTYTNVKIVREK